MLVNITKVLLIVLFLSCNRSSSVTVDKIEHNPNKCHLVQRFVEIGPDIFEPFGNVYEDFEKSVYGLDVLVRRLGQRSEIHRLYQIESGKFRLLKYNEKGLMLDEIIEDKPVTLEMKVGDYAFLCNYGSSDLGTHVYLLKKDGKAIGNLWFENGNFKDLSVNDVEPYEELERLISLLDT